MLITLVGGALIILAKCSDVTLASSYQEIMSTMCGRLGQGACELVIMIYCFGACITFLIIIGDQADSCKFMIIKEIEENSHS